MAGKEPLLTIDELAAAVALALGDSPVGELNGRVRALPDVRTLRYYTTLGLLDRPTRMEGRTALYSRRHVLQLVSIKRLQGRGFSLADIQSRLLHASDQELGRLAQLRKNFEPQVSESNRSTSTTTESRTDSPREPDRVFWKSRPAAAAETPPAAATALSPSVLLGVPLDAAASLLVQAVRPLDEDDLSALRSAAQPLLEVLRQRRLLS